MRIEQQVGNDRRRKAYHSQNDSTITSTVFGINYHQPQNYTSPLEQACHLRLSNTCQCTTVSPCLSKQKTRRTFEAKKTPTSQESWTRSLTYEDIILTNLSLELNNTISLLEPVLFLTLIAIHILVRSADFISKPTRVSQFFSISNPKVCRPAIPLSILALLIMTASSILYPR